MIEKIKKYRKCPALKPAQHVGWEDGAKYSAVIRVCLCVCVCARFRRAQFYYVIQFFLQTLFLLLRE